MTNAIVLNCCSNREWCEEEEEEGMLQTCLPPGKAGNFAILSKKTVESENVLSPAEGGLLFPFLL